MNTDQKQNGLVGETALTEKVIGCAFEVSNALGCGFLEKVYENALRLELLANGLKVIQQAPVHVWYREEVVGDYVIDLFVENRLLIELKAINQLNSTHIAQSLNYLKATRLSLALLINFGKPKLEFKRIQWSD